jgi:cation diffusion facilitator CzcD-associated flavoprotein CzcO
MRECAWVTEGGDRCPVGIIGAGGSEIVAAVALGRAGVDCEVLEARDGIGGTWRYDPHGNGSACYASLVTNTSRLRTSLRSGRIPGRPWQYAPHAQMLTYLDDLATRERLGPRIRLGWRVADAQRGDDGWIVRNSAGEERRYRALLCALGVNGRPHFAQFRGSFAGQQLHSAAYRTPDPGWRASFRGACAAR